MADREDIIREHVEVDITNNTPDDLNTRIGDSGPDPVVTDVDVEDINIDDDGTFDGTVIVTADHEALGPSKHKGTFKGRLDGDRVDGDLEYNWDDSDEDENVED